MDIIPSTGASEIANTKQEQTLLRGVDQLLRDTYGIGRGLHDWLRWANLDEEDIAYLKRRHLGPFIKRFLLQLGTIVEDRRLFQVVRLRYGLTGQEPLSLALIGAFYGLPQERIRQLQCRALFRLRAPRRQRKLLGATLLIALDLVRGYRQKPRWLPTLLSFIELPEPPADIIEIVESGLAGNWLPLADIPLEEVGITTRTYNRLRRVGIQSIGDLLALLRQGDKKLLQIPQFDHRCLFDVKTALRREGLWEESHASGEEVGPTPERPLTENEEIVYTALRLWRQTQAMEDGVPLYKVAYDHSLREIARQRPGSLEELSQIRGFGEDRLRRYGDRVLGVLGALQGQGSISQ